jgi:hypothetical protein
LGLTFGGPLDFFDFFLDFDLDFVCVGKPNCGGYWKKVGTGIRGEKFGAGRGYEGRPIVDEGEATESGT